MATTNGYADRFIKQLQQELAAQSNQAVAASRTGSLESNPGAIQEALITPDYSLPEGFWSRAIDVVSRPLYAVANFADSIVNNARDTYDPNFNESYESNPFEAAVQGLTGKSKKTFGNVFQDALPKTDRGRYFAGGLGFAGDIALDPVNLTPLAATKALSAVRGATKVGKEAAILDKAKDIKFADNLAKAAKDANKDAAPEMPIQPVAATPVERKLTTQDLEFPDILSRQLEAAPSTTGTTFVAGTEGVATAFVAKTSQELKGTIDSALKEVKAYESAVPKNPINPFTEWNGTRLVKDPVKQQHFVNNYKDILSSEDFATLQAIRSPQKWQETADKLINRAATGKVDSMSSFIEKAQNGAIPANEARKVFDAAGVNNLDELAALYDRLPSPERPAAATTAPPTTLRAASAERQAQTIEAAAADAFNKTPEQLANDLIDIENELKDIRGSLNAARNVDTQVAAKATTKTQYSSISHGHNPWSKMVPTVMKSADGKWSYEATAGNVAHFKNVVKKYERNFVNQEFTIGDWKISLADASNILGDDGIAKYILNVNTKLNPTAITKMEAKAAEILNGVDKVDPDRFVNTLISVGKKEPIAPGLNKYRTKEAYDQSLSEVANLLWAKRDEFQKMLTGKIIKDEQVTALAGKQLGQNMDETLRQSMDTAKEGSTTSAIDNLANVQENLNKIPEESVRSVASATLSEEVAKVANETDTLASKTVTANAKGTAQEAPRITYSKAYEEARQRNARAATKYREDAKEKLAAKDPEGALDQNIELNAEVERIYDKKMGVIDSLAHPYMYRAGEIGENWSQGWSSHLRVVSGFNTGITKAMRPFDESIRQAALLAYKTGEVPMNQEVRAAYEAMRPYLDQVLDITGTDAMKGAMFRDGHSVDTINAALKEQNSKFLFDTKAKTLEEAAASWKVADVDDVVDFVQKLHGAKSNLAMRSAVADHFASLYGLDHGGVINGIRYAKLPKIAELEDTLVWKHLPQDTYYPVEAIDQLKMMERILKQPTSFKGQHGWSADFVNKVVDPVLGIWKPGMTIIRPGHGVRNGISDFLLNVAAGVYHIRHYSNAGRILQAGKTLTPEIEKNFVKFATEHPSAQSGGKFAVTLKGGKTSEYSEQGMFQMAYQDGVLPTFVQNEDIIHDMGKTAKGLEKVTDRLLQTKYMQWMAKFNENESHFFRLAQYSKLMTDPKFTRKFSTIVEARTAAAKETIRFHPDTSRLSPVDKKYMRRIIPFWSWSRQMMPVVFETMFTHPARITAVNKAFYDAGIAFGNDPSSLGNPWPDNMLLPSFMRDRMGFAGGTMAFNLGSPTESMADLLNGNIGRNALGMLNPMVKAPIELLSRNNLQTGNYIPDVGEYIDQQLPGISQFATLSGISPTGTLGNWLTGKGIIDEQRATVRGDKQAFDARSIANFMTGIQLVNTDNSTFGRYGASELGRSGS